MDTKHTPGPWVAREYDGRIYIDTIEGLFRPGYMATGVLSFDARGNEANARLIAAAPDLLEALKVAERALNAMGDHINGMNAEEGISDEVNPAFESVRTAIAKATTRTP